MRKEEIAIPNERADDSANGFEPRPISPRIVLPALDNAAALNGPSLSQYLWVAKRHRWKLVAFVIFSVICHGDCFQAADPSV